MSLDKSAKSEVAKWLIGILIVFAVGVIVGGKACCNRAAEPLLVAPAYHKAKPDYAKNFFIPVSVARIDGQMWGGLGVGYTFPQSRMTLEGQYLFGTLDTVTLETDLRVGCRTYRQFVSGGGGSRTGVMFSIKVPLGR